MLTVYGMTIDHLETPLGLDNPKPCFSWKLQSSQNDTVQAAYQITITDSGNTLWDTGTVQSGQTVYIPYEGAALAPATRYAVTVTATDNHGEVAVGESWFETGLMGHENFAASWITHAFEDDVEPCAVFQKSFAAGGKVKTARVYASALGVYELALNGTKVGDAFFAPGWTCYGKRLQYQAYDITPMLRQENKIEMTVGNGWYKGVLGFHNQGNHFGPRTAAILQMEITYEDGTKDTILTDESWQCTTGPRRYSEIYHGEVIDYSLPAAQPEPAKLYDHPKSILIAQENEPVRITQRLAAQRLIITPKGEVVLDFGQNLTGVVQVCLRQPKGSKITIRHAEALDENGNFYTENLRTARATDTFICSGGDDVFLPAFTFHGFRYIHVDGLGDSPNLEDFTACVLHSDFEQTGRFECENEDVNRLWQNIDWTLRSNYLDVPTDCPQRDERLAYTGDAQMFISTAALHKNLLAFYKKWLRDLKLEQSPETGVPMIVPNMLGVSPGIAGWHEAAAIIPWTLWKTYGDKQLLAEHYDSIRDCVEYIRTRAGEKGLVHDGQQLGDWIALDMEKGPMRPRTDEVLNLTPKEKTGATDVFFIANAYYAYVARILADAAQVLGHEQDAAKYNGLYSDIIERFRAEYVTPTGRLISETQTACAFALQLNLVEEKHRKGVVETLLQNLREHRNHLTTGFAGTQFLCNVLTDNGAHDIAGQVFLQEDCPSWLYSVKLGATTIWELWDGVNPDGSFNKFEMNSLNQYALGAIGNWILSKLGGLEMLEPGYKKSKIAPRLIKGIPSMCASLETVYGELACAIACKNGQFTVDISVPVGTTAVVCLPEKDEITLGSGEYHYEYATELHFEKEPYSMENTLGELLQHPLGTQLMQQYAPEMMANEMLLMFAKDRPIIDMSAMMPKEAMQLFEMIIAQLNAAMRNA